METIGQRIKILRIKNNMSQKTLSKLTDIKTSNLSAIETGKNQVTIKNLKKIAKALNVNIYDIIKDTIDII